MAMGLMRMARLNMGGRHRDYIIREALAVDSSSASLWGWLGRALLSTEGPQSALLAFEKAAILPGVEAWELVELGDLYSKRGDLGPALTMLYRAERLKPGDAYIGTRIVELEGHARPAQ